MSEEQMIELARAFGQTCPKRGDYSISHYRIRKDQWDKDCANVARSLATIQEDFNSQWWFSYIESFC